MSERNSENNLLSNINTLGLAKAQEIVLKHALYKLNFEDVSGFEKKNEEIFNEYQSAPIFAISNSFAIDELDSFKSWTNELSNQKYKYILYIIAKMMKGDPIAHSIYTSIYSEAQPELILSYENAIKDENLEEVYMNRGAGIEDEAILQAQYWLASTEARNLLCSGQYDEEVNMILSAPCDIASSQSE